jgi:hypothetical protein
VENRRDTRKRILNGVQALSFMIKKKNKEKKKKKKKKKICMCDVTCNFSVSQFVSLS